MREAPPLCTVRFTGVGNTAAGLFTRPAPDGERIEGHARIRAVWEQFFAGSPQTRVDTEEIFAADDGCVVRWAYSWVKEGKPGHVRGVDVFRVRDGQVVEKLSYVKG